MEQAASTWFYFYAIISSFVFSSSAHHSQNLCATHDTHLEILLVVCLDYLLYCNIFWSSVSPRYSPFLHNKKELGMWTYNLLFLPFIPLFKINQPFQV